MPDRELSFVKGTLGRTCSPGWLLLLATFFYRPIRSCSLEMWGDTFPRVFFAWDNLIASLVFVVAVFICAATPRSSGRRSLDVDLDQLMEREVLHGEQIFNSDLDVYICLRVLLRGGDRLDHLRSTTSGIHIPIINLRGPGRVLHLGLRGDAGEHAIE